jgi:hypothetical protein
MLKPSVQQRGETDECTGEVEVRRKRQQLRLPGIVGKRDNGLVLGVLLGVAVLGRLPGQPLRFG